MSKKAKASKRNKKRRRMNLSNFMGRVLPIKAKFIKFSQALMTPTGIKDTVLIRNLKMNGNDLCDHLWLKVEDIMNVDFLKNLEEDTEIEFTATPYFYNVNSYGKIHRIKYSLKDIRITYVSKRKIA